MALALTGCSGTDQEIEAVSAKADNNWRGVATEADRERLRTWWDAWQLALDEARTAGYGADIDAQGPLLQPDAALPDPAMPPGEYRCRTIKLGSKGGNSLAYVAYPAFKCKVRAEKRLQAFAKLTGSQRPEGLVFLDNDRRSVFIGTLILGDEQEPLGYGVDASRDMIGMVERIGPRMWRLVLPWPSFESKVDVIELIPVER